MGFNQKQNIYNNGDIRVWIDIFFNLWLKVFLPMIITLGSLIVILGLGLDQYQSYLDQCVEREKIINDADIDRKCRLMEVEALIEERKLETSIRSSQILERENARELNHSANMAKINNTMSGSGIKWSWALVATGVLGIGAYIFSNDIKVLISFITLLNSGLTDPFSVIVGQNEDIITGINESLNLIRRFHNAYLCQLSLERSRRALVLNESVENNEETSDSDGDDTNIVLQTTNLTL